MSSRNLSEIASRDSFLKLKFVVLGDGSVGKTCILLRLFSNTYSDQYIPTILETSNTQMKINQKNVKLELWDTAGQEGYSEMRRLLYPLTDLFIIVFSVIDQTSFFNAFERWHPDLMSNCPKVNIIFVGNKIDLRDDIKVSSGEHIGKSRASELAGKFHCRYFECSAKNQEGVEEVFRQGAKICLETKDKEIISDEAYCKCRIF